jgi:hypothetical protein
MNIFELMTVIAVPVAGIGAYQFVSPYGIIWGILAGLVGALSGLFIGPIIGLLFILPLEGASRLVRFLMTGRWTDPKLCQYDCRGPDEDIKPQSGDL